ncbi:DMT family transporter [Sodalis sp. C49]|uniref:DMT family transporter n=1 Tax=unclassified Sodalis (in: enterobacteria) TaxID=2636512 RepID=UPI003965CF1D
MSQQRRADLLLVATTLIAGFGWIFSKESLQGMPTFGFIGARFLLAAAFLLPFCFGRRNHIIPAAIPGIIGVGCLQAVSLLLWIYAVSLSHALGEGAFIMSLSMLFVPLAAWILFRMPPSRPFWESLPLALAGLALLTLTHGWQLSVSQFWFLCAALAQAVYFCVNSRFARLMPVLPLTCIQLFCTGLCGVALSWYYETWPAAIGADIWLWFAASAIIATSLRFLLQMAGQKKTSVANAAIIMVLEPVWTVLLATLWYGENMPAQKAVGCCLILLALILYRGRQYLLLKKINA